MAKKSYDGKFFLSHIASHGKRQRIFILRESPSRYKRRKYWHVLVEEGPTGDVQVDGYVINWSDKEKDDPLEFQDDFAKKIINYLFSGSEDSLKLQSMFRGGE